MDKNTKLSQYLLQMIQDTQVYFTGSCNGVNSDGTVNVKRENGNSVNAIAANITGSGDCSVFLVEGQYYAFSASQRVVTNEAIAINRRSNNKIFQKLTPVFLLVNNESVKVLTYSSTLNSTQASLSIGKYLKNIKIAFVQAQYGYPLDGTVNSRFTINYPGGSYSSGFDNIIYGRGVDGYFQTPTIICSDTGSNDKTIDISYDFTFTDPTLQNHYAGANFVSTIVVIRVSSPVFLTDGIKLLQISTLESEYTYQPNVSSTYMPPARGGGNPVFFIFGQNENIYTRLYQAQIYRGDTDFYVTIDPVQESLQTIVADKSLNNILTPDHPFKGGSLFNFTRDRSLFLARKMLSISLAGRVDIDYNPLPYTPSISSVSVPSNQEVYELSLACGNFGVVIG